jgi:hypothetical protein
MQSSVLLSQISWAFNVLIKQQHHRVRALLNSYSLGVVVACINGVMESYLLFFVKVTIFRTFPYRWKIE